MALDHAALLEVLEAMQAAGVDPQLRRWVDSRHLGEPSRSLVHQERHNGTHAQNAVRTTPA
jgi:hypothetical protein